MQEDIENTVLIVINIHEWMIFLTYTTHKSWYPIKQINKKETKNISHK